MSAVETSNVGGMKRQVPSFVAVGLFGFVVDSALTYALVRGFAVSPYGARFPAFAAATVLNFFLNRRLTFAESQAPLGSAFARYCLVCAAGLAVNWSAYAAALWLADLAGYRPAPEALPLFVAFGGGVAMFVTFIGFKRFAFRL